jgi:hypothetical protein
LVPSRLRTFRKLRLTAVSHQSCLSAMNEHGA